MHCSHRSCIVVEYFNIRVCSTRRNNNARKYFRFHKNTSCTRGVIILGCIIYQSATKDIIKRSTCHDVFYDIVGTEYFRLQRLRFCCSFIGCDTRFCKLFLVLDSRTRSTIESKSVDICSWTGMARFISDTFYSNSSLGSS